MCGVLGVMREGRVHLCKLILGGLENSGSSFLSLLMDQCSFNSQISFNLYRLLCWRLLLHFVRFCCTKSLVVYRLYAL